MKETTVLGLFATVPEAAAALRRLRDDKGHTSRTLMVLSSLPFPEGVLDADETKSRLPAITLFFAFIGIGLGLLLAGGTALLYLLRQGGKPILSGPPIAIISYEVMMLSALTAAFIAALREMRLPNWSAKLYDRRIAEGWIGVCAHCAGDAHADDAESLMREAGAADVRRDARRTE